MAFSNFENQLEEDEDEVGGQPATKTSSGASSAPGGAGSGPSSAPVAPMGAGGGSPNNQRKFAGIQDYLKSNKQQTSNLANQVGGTVRAAGDEARGAITSGVDKFGKDVDKNTVKLDQKVVDRAANDPTGIVGNVKDTSNLGRDNSNQFDFDGGAFAGRNVVVNRPNMPNVKFEGDLSKQKEALGNLGDLTNYVKMRDAEYKGPKSLTETEYYNPMQKEVEEAEAASAAAKTEEGTKGLVGDLHKKQIGYVNTGALGLDNALLRGDQNARNIIAGAAASNDDLNRLLTGAVGTAAGRAAAGQSTTDRTRAIARGEVAGSRNDFNQDIKRRVDEAIANSNSVQEAIQNVVATGGDPTPEQLAAMGVTPEQWAEVKQYSDYLSLQDYLSTTAPDINAGNVATKEDYARDAALELLAGESDDLLTDPEMAGQYDDGVNFDIPTVISRIDEIKADKAKFDQQETNRLNQIAYSIGNAARAGGPPPEVDPEILKRRPYPGPGKW